MKVVVLGQHQEGKLKMKNEFHAAYRVANNYPLHIASPDSVREHVKDNVRLISMLPAEFPKVRGRDVVNCNIIESSMRGDIKVDRVEIGAVDGPAVQGYLINDKYYFSADVAGKIPSFQLMFKSFKDNNIKPMVRREWSWDYPSSNPFWYAIVESDQETYFNIEPYYDIEGYEEAGIDCLADLLAYSYKFQWSHERKVFVSITDPHEITKRIRKPWMSHLVQSEYGEAPNTTADMQKLINFLIQKCANAGIMTDEETAVIGTFLDNEITIDSLRRLDSRNKVLQSIIDAYNDPALITIGGDIEEDPLIFYNRHEYRRRVSND